MNIDTEIISSEEVVARLVSPIWVIDGILQPVAFTLNLGESYLSVNRLSVDSYSSDISAFILRHPSFCIDAKEKKYYRALLSVGDVRRCDVKVGNTELKINVEIEPRDSHTKSHAGIFVRFQNFNIKSSQTLNLHPVAKDVSTDSILLEVRTHLMNIASLELCNWE